MAQVDLAHQLRSLSFPGASLFDPATAAAELDSSPTRSAQSPSHADLPPSPGATRSHDDAPSGARDDTPSDGAHHAPAWERPSMFRATSYPASSADTRAEDDDTSTSFALGQRSPGASLPLPREIRSRDSSPVGEASTPRRGKVGLDPWGLASSRAAALMNPAQDTGSAIMNPAQDTGSALVNPAQETTRDSVETRDTVSPMSSLVKGQQGKTLKSALKGAQLEGQSTVKVPGRRVRFNKKVQVRQPKVVFVDEDDS